MIRGSNTRNKDIAIKLTMMMKTKGPFDFFKLVTYWCPNSVRQRSNVRPVIVRQKTIITSSQQHFCELMQKRGRGRETDEAQTKGWWNADKKQDPLKRSWLVGRLRWIWLVPFVWICGTTASSQQHPWWIWLVSVFVQSPFFFFVSNLFLGVLRVVSLLTSTTCTCWFNRNSYLKMAGVVGVKLMQLWKKDARSMNRQGDRYVANTRKSVCV